MNSAILCPRCKLAYHVNDGKYNRKPLLLTCGHTFCEVCLTQLAKDRKTSILCPTCFGDTPLSDGEAGVHSLDLDRYMIGQVIHKQKHMLESEINQTASVTMVHRKKETSDKDCRECLKKNATSYCAKCDRNLCGSCFQKVHSLSKSLRDHKPFPLKDDVHLEVSQMCKEHETRPLEYFCEDDETIICSRCVIVGAHKGHNISSIEDKNRLIVNEMEPNLQMANHVFRRLKRIDKEIAAYLPDGKKEVGPVLDEISQYFQYLHGVLQVREHQLQQEVMDVLKSGMGPIEKLRADLQTEYRQLDHSIKAAHRIMNNNDEVIVNAKDILDKLVRSKDIPCILEPSEEATTTQKISFIPGGSLNSLLFALGKVSGFMPKRFDLFTLRDRPEKFTEDKESLGTATPTEMYSRTSTPFESCSVASTCGSEDVVIEEEQEIILDGSEQKKSEQTGSESHPKQKQPKRKTTFSKRRTRNKVEDVKVTHIVNPRRFWVQLHQDTGKLTSLSFSLQQWCSSPAANKHKLTAVDVDDIVLAQYSADKQWYRSIVKQVIPPLEGEPFEKTVVEVLYFDFGNSERVPIKSLRSMQTRFMKDPEFSFECCLVDLLPRSKDGVWSLDAAKTFAQIVDDKVLVMTVMKEENNVLQVDLCKPPDTDIMDDCPASVRDALVFLELANLESPNSLPSPKGAPAPSRNFIRPESLEEGITYDIQVSFSGTPDCFFVQELGEEYEYLQRLTSDLQSTYSSRVKDSWQILCPYIGMICVAQFSGDEMWYRARIIDFPGNREVRVYYVDYGNVENTSIFKIRKILDSFLILPAQAIVCKLIDVEPNNVNEGWSDESLRWWSEMVTMHRFAMKIINIDDSFQVVMRQWDWAKSDSVNLKMVLGGMARSVGKWSEPPDVQVESSLSEYVPRLSYKTGEGSFPEPSDTDAQPVYWKSRKQVATRKYQETILTPPTSPILKTKPSGDQYLDGLDLVEAVPLPKQTPERKGKEPTSLKGSPEKPMDISPTQTSDKHEDKRAEQTDEVDKKTRSPSKKSPKEKHKKKKAEEVEVVVSHYVAPSEFHLQISHAGRVGLEVLMREMEEAYRNSEVEMISFKQGNYCAVLSPSDGRWYRGKIKKVLQKNLMEVFMLDFGFTEIVTLTSLRNILRQFRKERSFSFCCHLADLIPAGGMNEWSKTAIDLMKSEIHNKRLYLHKRVPVFQGWAEQGILTASDGLRYGDVVNNSLPVDLVIEKYVEESALEPGRRTFMSLIELMKERGLAIRKTKKETEKVKVANSFPRLYYKKAEAVVKNGDKVMPVYVDFDAVIHCYTMEGDDQFQNMCDMLAQKFRNSEPHGSEQVWEKGQGCAAFYEKDEQWHRASILALEPTKVQIHFIDYGNKEWVDYDLLRADIEDFLDVPQQTFLCMLHDIKPVNDSKRWDVKVLDFMHKEMVNKYCIITVIEKNGYENEHMTVNLELNGKDMGAVLVQYGMAKRGSYITDQQQQSGQIEKVLNEFNPFKTMPDVVIGGIIAVLVTHVELPNVVYLQNTTVDIDEEMTAAERKHVNLINEYLARLEQLSIELNKAAPRLPVIFSPKIGLPCCAQFGFDNCYYRAVIIDIYPETDQLLVLYVDYGNSEIITTQKMRALPPKYLSLPCQSIRCHLLDIVQPSDTVSWTKTALLEMMKVLANKPLHAKIASQKPLTVELFDPSEDGENVLVYQSVIDEGHVMMALKPVISPRSLEPKVETKTHAASIEIVCDSEVTKETRKTKDNIVEKENQTGESMVSSSGETTVKSWVEMAEEGTSVDLNGLPRFDDVCTETDGQAGKQGRKKMVDKVKRKERKVEVIEHDDECFD